MKLLTEPVVYTAALGVFCLIFYKIIYNIYLHPLSHIPGSKIATCSFLYEFYHDVLRGGMYMWEIEKMHQKYGPIIQTSTDLLCQKLKRANPTDQPVQLESLFADLTTDVISHCAFGQSYDYLRQDAEVINDIQHGATVFAVLKTLLPQYAQMLGRSDTIHENARVSLERGTSKNTDHDTIFEALTDATVPAEERTMPRLIDESWVILAAGTTTTARTLSVASFHIFSQGRILRRLREELRPVMPRLDSKPTFAELEGLPYLNAIVSEALRHSHGVLFRAPRIAPDDALNYNEFVIPAGTPVSISTYLTHMDPEFFPDPHAFRPERWLEAKQSGFPLHKYLVTFSRGHRQFLGIGLSYLEMYNALAHLARKFDMELYETTAENVSVGREMGSPFPEKVPYQVQVRVTRVVDV